MDVVNERCAGLDVHTRTVVACVRIPGLGGGRLREKATRTFGTTMAVHIGPCIQQQLDHRRVGVAASRFVQRGGSAAVNGVHIGARPQQQRHDIR